MNKDMLILGLCMCLFTFLGVVLERSLSSPPSCPDKHDAMRQAIEFSIDGYELGAPMPMQQKPIMVSDLGE